MSQGSSVSTVTDFDYDEWVLVGFVIKGSRQPPIQWVGLLVK